MTSSRYDDGTGGDFSAEMNGLNGLWRETGSGTSDADHIGFECGNGCFQIFPGGGKSRGVNDLNLIPFSFQVGT
jgi:hypothetical protein